MSEKTAWENLSNAIVVQAVDDYRDALRILAKHPDYERRIAAEQATKGSLVARLRMALRHTIECEAFFRSAWFGELTRIDPEMLIRVLRAERDEPAERGVSNGCD